MHGKNVYCRKSTLKILKKIKNFIRLTPVEKLLNINDFKTYDLEFYSKFQKENILQIYSKYLIGNAHKYTEVNNYKLNIQKALRCSQECFNFYIHIISILEYSFCLKKLSILASRLKTLKVYIRNHKYRIEFLKNNFKKLIKQDLKIKDNLKIDGNYKLHDYNSIYKKILLFD